MISIIAALAISSSQAGQFLPASLVVMRSLDVISQRHVSEVLMRSNVKFAYTRSVAVEYVTNADPMKLLEMMNQFAPKEEFLLEISGSGSNLLRPFGDLKPQFIPLKEEELLGRAKAPFNIHKVLRSARSKFKNATTLNSVSFLPRKYLATKSQYAVAFEVRLEFADVTVRAQVIGSDIVSLWKE